MFGAVQNLDDARVVSSFGRMCDAKQRAVADTGGFAGTGRAAAWKYG